LLRSPTLTNRSSGQRLESRQPAAHGYLRDLSGRFAPDRFIELPDVIRRRSATAAHHIHETARGEFRHDGGHLFGGFIIFSEFIGQAGVRVSTHARVGDPRKLGDVGPKVGRTQRAVEADHERLRMPHRIPECLGRLPRQRPAGGIRDRAGNHDRQLEPQRFETATHREDRRLRIEGVEDRFDHEKVDAAFDQRHRGNLIRLGKPFERGVAVTGIVHVGRDRRGAIARAQNARNELRFTALRGKTVGGLACEPGCRTIEVSYERLHAVVAHRRGIRVERVGFDDVGAGFEELPVDVLNQLGTRYRQQVVVALQVPVPLAESLAAEIVLCQAIALNHSAHRTIEKQDSLRK